MIKVIIDHQPVEYWYEKEMAVDLLKQTMINCEYRSIENIKENILKMIDLIVSGHPEMDKRFSRKLLNSIRWINSRKIKEETIENIYNLILSIEGLGNLTGFGEIKNYQDENIFVRIS